MRAGFLGRNWFTLGIFAAVAAAFAFPGGSTLNAGSRVTSAVTIAVFLVTGLTLPSETFLRDLRGVRLHLCVLGLIFVVNPLYFFLTTLPFAARVQPAFLAGIYALSCLPTTISSSIVFTQAAGGNTAAAVFHSALSNTAGVFLSPLILSLLVSGAGRGLPPAQLGSLLGGIVLRMLLPLAAGQLARIRLRASVARHSAALGAFNSALILVLIYFAAATAAANPGLGPTLAANWALFVYLAASAPIIAALAWCCARLAGLARRDAIEALFAGSQKTMAMGIPLLSAYLASRPDILGIAVLPLVFYHPVQLVVSGAARSLLGSRRRSS
jgi:sodium/bile acid cotransporter 7